MRLPISARFAHTSSTSCRVMLAQLRACDEGSLDLSSGDRKQLTYQWSHMGRDKRQGVQSDMFQKHTRRDLVGPLI